MEVVMGRRHRNFFFGTKNSSNKVKCAKKTFDVYIGRCDRDVECHSIIDCIKNEIGVSVNWCLCLTEGNNNSKSFKVTIDYADKGRILDAAACPENICLRKFYHIRHNGYPNKDLRIVRYSNCCSIRKKFDILRELMKNCDIFLGQEILLLKEDVSFLDGMDDQFDYFVVPSAPVPGWCYFGVNS